MPLPNLKRQKIEYVHGDDDYYFKGIELKKIDQEKALHYFKKSFKSGNFEAGYQIGRIYSLMNDSRCILYLNDLSLSGHKKSQYYLALFFEKSKYKSHYKVMNYFYKVSDLILLYIITRKHDKDPRIIEKIRKYNNIDFLFNDNQFNVLFKNTNW